jgi:hypothetical protein
MQAGSRAVTVQAFNRMDGSAWLEYAPRRGYRARMHDDGCRPALALIVLVEDDLADVEVEIRVGLDRLGPRTGPQWRQVVARELWEARRTARRLRNLQHEARKP